MFKSKQRKILEDISSLKTEIIEAQSDLIESLINQNMLLLNMLRNQSKKICRKNSKKSNSNS